MSTYNVTVAGTTITVTIAGGVASGSVAADTAFYFDGSSGDTYLKYVSATGKLEVWVDGVKKQEW